MILGATLAAAADKAGFAFSAGIVGVMLFPLVARAFGLLASIVGILIVRTREDADPMQALNRGYYVTAALAIAGFFVATKWLLQNPSAPDAWWKYFLCGIIGVLMGVGAIFGAVITMYTAVASRTREIATLRALGFSSFPVVVSVLVEAVMLAIVGGLVGGAIAYLAFNGFETATMNFQSFSQMAFQFAVTPKLLGMALFYAVIMGLFGGVLPAIRAARLPVVTALREL